jgi:hypothetical protein
MGKVLLSIIFIFEILREISLDIQEKEVYSEHLTTQEQVEAINKIHDLIDRLPT